MLVNKAVATHQVAFAPPESAPSASLRNVTVRFSRQGEKETTALDDVNLELRRGEFLVLVGASGSGKTTALNVLAGLTSPTEGRAEVLGKEPRAARNALGYMFARDALLPWRTARRNIEFGLEVRGMPAAQRREKASELLAMVQLPEYGSRYPTQLSQGQRQRIALARTWALSPEVLLMDEPFSALDAQTREALQAEFLRVWAAERKSVVFVTHDLNEAITLADRILVFAKGKIAHEFKIPTERPRDILDMSENPALREIYRTIRALIH